MYAKVYPATGLHCFKVVCETGFTDLVVASSKGELIDKAKAVVAEAEQQPSYQIAQCRAVYTRGRYVSWPVVKRWVAGNQGTYVRLPDGGRGKLAAFPPRRQEAAALFYLKGGTLTV
jgi:hypothetical protein